jgi:hypothetical protein
VRLGEESNHPPRFTAVSEHPMPLVAVHAPNTPGDEVSFIGPDEG